MTMAMTMTNLAPTNQTRLPAARMHEATQYGMKVLATFDRLGFIHTNLDGRTFTLRFSEACILCDNGEPVILAYTIDTERMWHFSPLDIMKPRVVSALQSVCKKPVWITNRDGLVVSVELKPAQEEARLPARVELDLEQRPGGELMVPMGVSRVGHVWLPLPELRHCLIVGATGAGKSSWLHCALAGLLTGCGPDSLRVILIDAKRAELATWAAAPHVMGSLAYTESQAAAALAGAVDEIERRGDLFTEAGARDLRGYHRRALDLLPSILVVVDEALDLILDAGPRSELVQHVKTIAMRGRSTGVYLWLATQHAAAVTGLPRVVNVNLCSRVVFRVLDGTAAFTAGCPGAQDIPHSRPGRMLVRINDKPVEMQGYFLSDKALAEIAGGVEGTRPNAASLSDLERELVKFAWGELGGGFVIGKLARQFGKGQGAMAQLAARWERRGWLTPQASRNAPRCVTEALLEAAGLVPAPVHAAVQPEYTACG